MKRLILALSITLTAWLSHAQTPYLVKAGITLYSNQVLINGTIYFSAYDGTNGIELWKSDGSEAGTVMVKDIYPGSNASSPQYLTNANDKFYFVADNGTNGRELWKSDGTATGTVMVKDINPGGSSAFTSNFDPYFTNVNGILFFYANDGTNGAELWKSDGTEAGTVMVKDIYSGSGSSLPESLTNVNGVLYFVATNGTLAKKLWKSDGTSVGTVMVKDIYPGGNIETNPSYLTNVNGILYFGAINTTTIGRELWKSDGTSAGTVMVKNINTTSGGSSGPSSLTNVNGVLYFVATNGTAGQELWKSDGAEVGTVMVKDIRLGSSGSSPNQLTNVNGTLYFRADNGTNGYELWKSDGTETSTVMVKDIYLGSSGSWPFFLTNVNGSLYFMANNGTNGYELWKSDGTEIGTVMISEINPGSGSSFPTYLTNVNGTLYFGANDGMADEGSTNSFWALNTNEGTLPVSLLNFTATAKNNGAVLTWQTANEVNNSHFIIKRSTNRANFTEIGKVAPANCRDGQLSVSTPNAYTFTDKTPANGTNYYQLLQVDLDGKTTDLGVRTLNFGLPTSDIRLYPNPVADKLNIGNARAGAVYTIYNNVGKKTANGTITDGINQINVSALPQGAYLINVDGKTMKFVKE